MSGRCGFGRAAAAPGTDAPPRFGLPSGDDFVADVLSQYDADADAAISLAEFTAYVRKKDKQMREVFKSLDVDATGELGAAEVVRAMRRLGIGATEADGAKMVRLLDSNRDGAVTFSEFKQYTSLLPAAQLRANAAYVWMGTSVDRLVTNPRDPAKNLVVGAAAGAVSRFLTAPLERLRVILMAQKDATALAAVRAVVRDEGVAGLWRGSAAKILKVMPASAIQFTAFAAFKNLFLSRSRTGELTVPETLASGALAGLVRWVRDRRRLLRLAGPPQVADPPRRVDNRGTDAVRRRGTTDCQKAASASTLSGRSRGRCRSRAG